jgi:hypothetical protein
LRAQIMAGRKKGQYWPRPKDGIFEDLVSVLHGINWARLKKTCFATLSACQRNWHLF